MVLRAFPLDPWPAAVEWALQLRTPMPNFKAISGALAALAMLGGGAAHGENAAVPLVFGVDIGTTTDDLEAVLRAKGISCQLARQAAIICPKGLAEVSDLPGTSTTYWLVDGRVSRIYQMGDMASLGQANYSALVALFESRRSRIQSFLGDIPPREKGREPNGHSGLDDDARLEGLRSGRLGREVIWEGGGRKISLSMRGERGKALLVLGLEATSQPAAQAKQCSNSAVAAWMMDLFPPAAPLARATAARGLADCGIDRSAGALVVALAHDEDESVRSATIGALGVLGRAEPLKKLLADAEESDRLRAAALHALEKRGESPSPSERTHLRKGAGALLAQALKENPSPTTQPRLTDGPPTAPSGATTPVAAASRPAASAPPAPAQAQPSAQPTATYSPIAHPSTEAPSPAPTPEPETPPPPPKPSDGAALAITASTLAGGLWGLGLSKLALQDSVGFITLAGSAGAIIGGGTAFGLVHFGKRPSIEQALFYTNSTAWGSLAGLLAWAGSGSDSVKLEYGFLVGGELTGIAAGVYGARRWSWTASQVFLADSLVLAGGIGGLGVERMATDSTRLDVPAWLGYSAAPAMVAFAIASRYLDVSTNDLQFAGLAAASTAWTTGLVASGIDGSGLVSGHVGQGGLMLGLSAGYVAAIAASPFIDVTGSQSLAGTGALLLGNSIGLGTHMLIAPESSPQWKLGAGLGGVGLLAAGAVAAPYLRLGPQAAGMGAAGLLFGASTWGLANLAAGRPADARLGGGLLAFAPAAGIVGALASSKFDPDAADYATTAGTTALGMSAGLGVGMLATQARGNGEFVGVLGGSATGLAAGALLAHSTRLQVPDVGGAALGAAQGVLLGQLVPSLQLDDWQGSRTTTGATWLGLSIGAAAGAGLAHASSATGGNVLVASVGGLLGTGMGAGAGLLWAHSDSQPERIGVVAGSLGGIAGSLLLDRQLHLSEGVSPSAPTTTVFGGLAGVIDGLFLADVLYPTPGADNNKAREGGAVFGASLGITSGLILSKRYDPSLQALATAGGASLAGAFLGRGLVMLSLADPANSRPDSAGTMAGSLAGLGAGALVARYAPLGAGDVTALPFGAGLGGLVGALAPTLGDTTWPGWQRNTQGGLFLGVGAGSVAAVALAHALDATPAAAAASGLGAAGGLATGMGVGMMLDGEGESRGQRIGMVAGLGAGLGLGTGLWARADFHEGSLPLLAAALAVGGFNGALIPRLGHAQSSDVSLKASEGGILAGAGAGSLLAASLATRLDVDPDLTLNAVTLDGIFTGAGAGIGILSSERDDAPVVGMLAAGGAGLLLGGVLHNHINVDERDVPFLAFAGAEGLWFGGFLPYVLRPSAEVQSRQIVAGLAAGGLGATGTAILTSRLFDPSSEQLAKATLGSVMGAEIAGGAVLLAGDLHDQRGYGLMLGGTALGLGLGALSAPFIDMRGSGVVNVLAGSALGAAEGLVFAWAGRSSVGADYAGAGLIGAGLGAGLGVAAATSTDLGTSKALTSTGFAAWGAWMGAFSGALASRDPHEVTLGGLGGANLGALIGYGLVKTDLVDPRDFGWLSLAGAIGTALGGGVGAALSSKDDPRPALAGLAAGPLLGLATGAVLVPRLRSSSESHSMFVPGRKVAGMSVHLGDSDSANESAPATSADVLADAKPSAMKHALHELRNLFDVASWSPMVGALPQDPGTPGAAPFLMGVTGTLR